MDEQAVALLNANNTFGQIAGHKAMTLAIDKARQYGTGVVAVKNSNHFGVAAYYAMMALKEDMVGCVFTNSSPAMAVYGTKTPLIGTNPIAIAIPAGDHFPIVLDMSTSVVARGKIRYAALTGHAIPLGWARDIDGKPTEDAKAGPERKPGTCGRGEGLGPLFNHRYCLWNPHEYRLDRRRKKHHRYQRTRQNRSFFLRPEHIQVH